MSQPDQVSSAATGNRGGSIPESDDAALVEHIVATTGLTQGEASRVIADVVAWYSEGVTDLVRRRHAELKLRGYRNDDAFEIIAAELGRRLVAPPPTTVRQLRRMIYG